MVPHAHFHDVELKELLLAPSRLHTVSDIDRIPIPLCVWVCGCVVVCMCMCVSVCVWVGVLVCVRGYVWGDAGTGGLVSALGGADGADAGGTRKQRARKVSNMRVTK